MRTNITLLILPFLFILNIGSKSSDKHHIAKIEKHASTKSYINNKTMGVSINLYRLPKAESLNEIKDLEK